MKTGIIIVFHNSESEINKEVFISYTKQLSSLKFCLVNNESKDNTYEILKEIKEQSENVYVVNIKKFKSDLSAVKAGARFMFNQHKFNQLGYVNMNLLNKKYQGLNYIIQGVFEHQDSILKYDQKLKVAHKKRSTLFQKLYSVTDYITKLEMEKQTQTLTKQNKS